MNRIFSIAVLLLAMVFFFSATQAEPSNKNHVGIVILVSGDVTAVGTDNKTRFLKRRSKFYVGDIVQVAMKARAQLRFMDGTLVSLDENTQIKIDDFSFSNDNQAENKNFFTLIKGGLRTITGAIGKSHPNSHAVNTPVATIGVRGTQYSAHFGKKLSVGVYQGDVTIKNKMGSLDIGAHGKFNYALVHDQSSSPVGSLVQPKILAPLSSDNRAQLDNVTTYKKQQLLDDKQNRPSHQLWSDEKNNNDLIYSETELHDSSYDESISINEENYALKTGDPLYNSSTDFRLTDKERSALHRLAIAVSGKPDRVLMLKDRILRMKSTDVTDTSVDHIMVDAVGDSNTGLPRYTLRKSLTTGVITPTELTSYTRNDAATSITDIRWGQWDTQFINQYDSMDPASFEEINNALYWITATPTDPLSVAALSGTINYSDLQAIEGVTNNGLIDNASGSANITIDFSGSIFSGNIGFNDAGASIWSLAVGGTITGSALDFNTVSATHTGGSAPTIEGVADSVFVGTNAELIGGGFNVVSTDGSGEFAQGIFVIGCNTDANC